MLSCTSETQFYHLFRYGICTHSVAFVFAIKVATAYLLKVFHILLIRYASRFSYAHGWERSRQ